MCVQTLMEDREHAGACGAGVMDCEPYDMVLGTELSSARAAGALNRSISVASTYIIFIRTKSPLGAEDGAQVSQHTKAWVQSPGPHKLCVLPCACILRTQKVEAQESEARGHSLPLGELEAR